MVGEETVEGRREGKSKEGGGKERERWSAEGKVWWSSSCSEVEELGKDEEWLQRSRTIGGGMHRGVGRGSCGERDDK
jgi:hypothetical protein